MSDVTLNPDLTYLVIIMHRDDVGESVVTYVPWSPNGDQSCYEHDIYTDAVRHVGIEPRRIQHGTVVRLHDRAVRECMDGKRPTVYGMFMGQ